MAREATHKQRIPRVQMLRNFLMRKPRPTAVRVVTSDGESVDYQLPQDENFSELADRFDSLEPEKITAYAEDGTPIRAWRAEDLRERNPQIEIPGALAGDANAAMLLHFGNLLARAYEHSTEVAFDRLAGLIDRILEESADRNERLQALEDLYFGAMRANAEMIASQGGADGVEEGDFQAAMMQQFLQGQAKSRREKQRTTKPVEADGEEAAE